MTFQETTPVPAVPVGSRAEGPTDSIVEVQNLWKSYDPVGGEKPPVAVAGISFDIKAGELFTLLGPSGCGKSTTLRCISGLEVGQAGRIEVGGSTFFDASQGINVAPESRGLGMVFQSYAVWPHMSVFDNVAFPLTIGSRRRRPPAQEVRKRVMRVLETVQLESLAERPAPYLSGGQQQRLALARALVVEPPVLLLDEPLSNLDASLREEMWIELKRLQQELGISAVYVTHDQVEALAMSDRLAVMSAGEIKQIGAPNSLYEHPETLFVARFIGRSNLIPGRVSEVAANACVVDAPFGRLHCLPPLRKVSRGAKAYAVTKPESVVLRDPAFDHEGTATTNQFSGRIESMVYLGDSVDYLVRVGSVRLRCSQPKSSRFAPGQDVSVTLPAEQCIAIASDSSRQDGASGPEHGGGTD